MLFQLSSHFSFNVLVFSIFAYHYGNSGHWFIEYVHIYGFRYFLFSLRSEDRQGPLSGVHGSAFSFLSWSAYLVYFFLGWVMSPSEGSLSNDPSSVISR